MKGLWLFLRVQRGSFTSRSWVLTLYFLGDCTFFCASWSRTCVLCVFLIHSWMMCGPSQQSSAWIANLKISKSTIICTRLYVSDKNASSMFFRRLCKSWCAFIYQRQFSTPFVHSLKISFHFASSYKTCSYRNLPTSTHRTKNFYAILTAVERNFFEQKLKEQETRKNLQLSENRTWGISFLWKC